LRPCAERQTSAEPSWPMPECDDLLRPEFGGHGQRKTGERHADQKAGQRYRPCPDAQFLPEGVHIQSWWRRVHRSESLCSVGATTHISVTWVASNHPLTIASWPPVAVRSCWLRLGRSRCCGSFPCRGSAFDQQISTVPIRSRPADRARPHIPGSPKAC